MHTFVAFALTGITFSLGDNDDNHNSTIESCYDFPW